MKHHPLNEVQLHEVHWTVWNLTGCWTADEFIAWHTKLRKDIGESEHTKDREGEEWKPDTEEWRP